MRLGLGQRRLVTAPGELVAPVSQPVRPRDQRLASPAAAALVLLVPVEQRPVGRLICAQPTPDLDHDNALLTMADLMLGA